MLPLRLVASAAGVIVQKAGMQVHSGLLRFSSAAGFDDQGGRAAVSAGDRLVSLRLDGAGLVSMRVAGFR
ncbi:hypothetical protein ASF73_18345 [Xanthomonas sp. Leaf131]|nr:hypothetical protein ASF73_18345 [Xanthomonas sp. Leaf131]